MTEENTRIAAEKLLGLLGLARRAGKLGMGVSAVEKMVVKGENPMVIAATDMGESLKSKVARKNQLLLFPLLTKLKKTKRSLSPPLRMKQHQNKPLRLQVSAGRKGQSHQKFSSPRK